MGMEKLMVLTGLGIKGKKDIKDEPWDADLG